MNKDFYSNCLIKLFASLSSKWNAILIYLAFLFDNILLTMIVPILPYLLNNTTDLNITLKFKNESLSITDKLGITAEYYQNKEGSDVIGGVLAVKAIVQLLATPFVGFFINRFGYFRLQIAGTLLLLASSLIYTFGQSTWIIIASRSIHGLSSACLSISGMAIIAELYPEEVERSNKMGFTLSGMALGVLIGYPFGGFTYDIFENCIPFLIFSFALIILIAFQFFTHYKKENQQIYETTTSKVLLRDYRVILSIGAIAVSTSSISILESCLPTWLVDNLHPQKWQLGTVFIPDSVGYLIGTNFFAEIAFKKGRWFVGMFSMALVGICAMTIPMATKMSHLILPHFGLGLGIGITDAAILPLLAYLVDTRYDSSYGSIYALSQTAVCLAYSFGPIIGGQLSQHIGFVSLFRTIGLINIIYSPLCLALRDKINLHLEERNEADFQQNINKNHKTFYNSFQLQTTKYSAFLDED